MTMEDVRKDGAPQDLDALRAEIERTRAELGDTVQALAAKADVKARAKEQVEQTRAMVAERINDARDTVVHRAHEAKDIVSLRAHEAKDVVAVRAHDAQDTVRRNPVPAAAIAAGCVAAIALAIWLIQRRR